jgi:dipeptidyl aminopeptidase/acylaminoacyl peptidase
VEDAQKLTHVTATEKQDQATRLPATLDTLLDERYPNDVQISADGRFVAFGVWESVPGEQAQRQRIWIAETKNGEAHPLISGKSDESCPRWSPDGKYLAFITKPEGKKEKPQVHLIAAEGGKAGLLCKLPNGVSDLAWAPDGSRITFLSLEGEESKSDPKVLIPARHRRLWVIRQDQAIPEPVTPSNLTVWEYSWAPDSKQLALYYSYGPETNDWYHSQIGLVSSNGGAVRQLTHLTWQARALAWSPDGKHLAYLSGRWSDPGRGSGDLFTLSLEDGQIRNLTPNITCSPSWSCWLPDNRHLLFTAVKNVTSQVSLLDSSDGTITLLEADFVMQGDQPELTMTPDRRICATIHSTAQLPLDVWSGQLTYLYEKPTGIAWQRLSRLNPLIEETVELARTERINYTSLDDWRIDGLFTPPTKAPTNALPPLYVEVHGGPSATDCDGWFANTHLLAAHGFAVFRPNMRGSWGRGLDFADAVVGDMGGKDFQDILNGIEYLVTEGRVDGQRICIGGWSNGGFLSAWAVTQSRRFRAAMVGAGITDWHNMHAQTNTPDADAFLLASNALKQPETYRQHSPITYAEQVTTPTLILHGEDDPIVPVAQAYTFYRALQERHVPVECVIYPREGHGLAERDHLRDALERILKWLEQHIQ